MGNLIKNAKAIVNVSLETSIIFPGEIVNGKINIKPNQSRDITSLQNPRIDISLSQEQNWQSFIFSEEDKSTRNGESFNNFFSNKTLNCIEYKGKNFSDGMTIPFQYQVPDDITPSFEWPHTRYEFAYVRNFLNINIPELFYKTKILLLILKKPCLLESPLTVTTTEERKKFLLFGKGSIIVEGSYPTSSYPILGNIPLTVRIDASSSDVIIKEVTVKLKRKLQFYSKTNLKSTRDILQNMYEEKKKVCSKYEDLHFNIPFKDSNEIEYSMNCSALGNNTEVCCLLPNISTNTINVIYYIKIIADPDDLLAKKIELKMMVDFYSKDEKINRNVYDNFNKQIKKINSGDPEINYMEPYLQHQKTNNYNKRMSQDVLNYQHSLNTQNEFNLFPNQIQNQNQIYENNNYNGNAYSNDYAPAPNYFSNNQNMNNQINNYPNYNLINNNNPNPIHFPAPPKDNSNEESDLPTLEEIEEHRKNRQKEEGKRNINNIYPSI